MNDNSTAMNALRDEYRDWLSRLGILERPWIILGSAPNPTIPLDLVDNAARVDINNAGRTAANLGLGRADLTVRREKKAWSEHEYLDTRGLLWVHRGPVLRMRWEIFWNTKGKVDSIFRWSRKQREATVNAVAGDGVGEIGQRGKATTGVAAACYGLFVGVPKIVMCGFSIDAAGHSYDDLNRPRLQVEEDLFVLQRICGRPELHTTEPDFAAATGLKLWPGTAPS